MGPSTSSRRGINDEHHGTHARIRRGRKLEGLVRPSLEKAGADQDRVRARRSGTVIPHAFEYFAALGDEVWPVIFDGAEAVVGVESGADRGSFRRDCFVFVTVSIGSGCITSMGSSLPRPGHGSCTSPMVAPMTPKPPACAVSTRSPNAEQLRSHKDDCPQVVVAVR